MTDGGRLSTVHWQTAPIPNDGILQDSLFEFKLYMCDWKLGLLRNEKLTVLG